MDQADYFDQTGLRSPFYRVAAKAIVRDEAGRVLAVADSTGTYELPGGGWEHDESFEETLRREFKEELGAKVVSVGNLLFLYRGRGTRRGLRRRHLMLRIVAEVKLASHNFKLDQDEVTEARFVDRDEFVKLNWCDEDREVVEHVDKLWPLIEKPAHKR